MIRLAIVAAATIAASVAAAQPLTTAFTFQGELNNGASPVNGTYDLKFTLFDAPTGGAQVGAQLCSDNVVVANGLVTVQLDFGAQFTGQQRFLEVWVRPDTGLSCANTTGFTILGPRQNLTAAPNSVFALSAANATTATSATTANNATQLNGQPSSFYTSAANLSTGTLPDARLSTNVALLSGTQTFTGSKTFSGNTTMNGFVGIGTSSPIGAANFVLHQSSSSFGGMYVDTNAGGLPFYGYSEGGGAVAFHYVDGGDSNTWKLFMGGNTRLAVTTAGSVGIGTSTPSSLLEVQGALPQLRLRNNGDQGGSYLFNTASATFFGFYNPGASAWGAVPAGGTKSFFAIQNQGLVCSTVETPPGSGSYVPRNTLDDGSGGAYFSGSTTITTLNVSGASDFAGVNTFHANTTFNNPVTLSSGANSGFLTLDSAGIATSTGLFQNQVNVLRFGSPSGEGITSKRTAGGNQFGLDLYAGQSPRISITNSGNVGIGNTSPGTKLNVRDGMLNVDATSGGGQAQMYISGNHAGNFAAFNASNNYVAVMGESQAAPTLGGQMLICNSGGGTIAGLQVTAANQCTLTAQVKNFMVPNPDDVKTDIYYACVEGPEAAMYCRGTGHLEVGHAVIDLPRHFAAMAAAQGLTVQVTPLSADCMGLAVTEKSTDSFEVTELFKGQNTCDFDWEVKAVRKGYEDYKVIRPAGALGTLKPAPQPSQDDPAHN